MNKFIIIKAEHVQNPSTNLEQVVNTDHIISVTSFDVDENKYSLLTIIEIDKPLRLNITATEFKRLYLE